jgi:CheY-like chemotaxis protein
MAPGETSSLRWDRSGRSTGPEPLARHEPDRRLETVGLLAGGVAHDFNNALTAILGYSDLMMRRMGPDHELRRYAEEIGRAARGAARLTRQLTVFSKRGGGKARVLSLNDVVTGLAKMLGRIVGEDLVLETRLDPTLVRTRVSEGEIEQVVVNLALGIRRRMPHGGRLRIETSNLVLDPRSDRTIDDLRPGAYARLSVIGQGRDLIEPGHGIESGVLGVTRLVRRAGGSVQVAPVSEDRTAYHVCLPAAEGGERKPGEEDPVPVLQEPSRETVLVVEDDPLVRGLVRQVLETTGYRVLVASCGTQALEMVDAYEQRIDLVLTDIVMPGLPGPETARRILERRPGLKILFMSGYADETLASHGLPAHTDGFLAKPFAPDALTETVRNILAD